MLITPIRKVKNIHWAITSKTDPRWDGSGGSKRHIVLYEASKHLKNCRKKYGKQPKDLMYEAYKE